MLLSKRDESRTPSLHRSPSRLLLPLLVSLCGNAFENLPSLCPSASCRFPRVTLELAEIRGTTWGDGFLLDLRGFSPVNGGEVGRERAKRRGREEEERTQRRSPYWRGWWKKQGENAKCNPQSRRCSRSMCGNVGRKQCSRHSTAPLSSYRQPSTPGIFRRFPRWHTEAVVSSGAVIRNPARRAAITSQ